MERDPATQLRPVSALKRASGNDGLSVRAWISILVVTAMVPLLLVWRLRTTGRGGHVSTGTTDLLLAWAPLPMALLVSRLAAMRKVRYPLLKSAAMWIVGALWLLFFPNSPYLITELLHLDSSGHYGPSSGPSPRVLHFIVGDGPFRKSAPVWMDLLFLVTVAACGAMLTFASLRMIHGAIARRLRPRAAAAAICGLILLGSFGVALGRFERFNSWNVASKPDVVLQRIYARVINPEDSPDVTAWTLGLAVILAAGYFGARDLGPPLEAVVE
jgi:uncharacterized membrane protein